MVKILKNTTTSDIELNTIGLTIPANSQITIQVEDYLLLASEDSITEITPLINSGDIIVNDGIDDLFLEKGINFIKYQDNFKSKNDIYVDISGSDSTGDGSNDNPFATLTGVYNSISSGNYGTPSSTNPMVIIMSAGFFNQDPVDFSAFEGINIQGKSLRTRINALNPNSNLLTMGPNSGLRDISLSGVTNSNNYHLHVSAINGGGFSTIDLSIVFGSNGIKYTNSSGNLTTTSFNTLSVGLTGSIFQPNDNVSLSISNYNAIGNLTSTIGVEQNGNSDLFLLSARLTNMNTVIQANGTGITQLVSLIDVNSNSSLDQNGTGIIEILGGNFNASKVNVLNTSKIEGYFLNELPDEIQFRVISELSVGLPNRGRESVFGEGDSYTNGMQVWTESSEGVFTNVSNDAASRESSTFTFPSTSVNNAIYISTAFDQVNPIKWYGFKASIAQASVLPLLGDIVFEYWNGSSWVEFNHMIVTSNIPFRSTANEKFTSTGNKQVYFDSRLEQNWITNDPVSLGINLYWIRIRIDGVALTTRPIFEQFKIHTNRMEIDSNGFQLMYGTGRIKEKFPISLGGLLPNVGRSPNSQDFYLSDNLGIAGEGNSFPTNQSRSKLFTQFVPFELDTSSPVDLTISYYGDSSLAGTVQWEVIWATSNVNEGVYSSTALTPSVAENERSVVITDFIPALNNNRDRILSFRLEVPEVLVQQTNGDPQSKIWIRLTRDVSGVDNYNGNVILTDFTVFYTAWREGGYVGEF